MSLLKTAVAVLLIAVPHAFGSSSSSMRHSLREIMNYDASKMVNLVNKEIESDKDDDAYLTVLARILAQTVLIQPHFTEREAAVRELKGKITQEDYIDVVKRAGDVLLSIADSSEGADEATAKMGLLNFVIEARSLHNAGLKPILKKIAEAKLELSESAKKYADESMQKIASASSEAQAALQKL